MTLPQLTVSDKPCSSVFNTSICQFTFRAVAEGVQLLRAIQEVYLSEAVTAA